MYIINSAGIAYHQLRKKLYIIKPTEYTPEGVMRYNNGDAVVDDIQPCRADDIPSLSAWIKKSDKSKLVGFFVFTAQFSNNSINWNWFNP